VARNLERAEKMRLQREIKDAIGSVGVGALYEDDAALADMTAPLRDQSGRSLQKDTCQAVIRWRRRVHRLHWSCSFLGLGPDAASSSALCPSRSGSQWTAVSLRGEPPHPVLVTPCRVGLDELQQLFGKRRTISQIVPRLLVDGSYPIPSSHWSFPVAEKLSGADAATRCSRHPQPAPCPLKREQAATSLASVRQPGGAYQQHYT
jgi:hypothetical protein